LIDSGGSHSYIDPNLVERLHLEKCKHERSWTVQLAIGIRKKFSELVRNCSLDLNGLKTVADLNILPLGSYHVLVRMDWLEPHRVVLDCYGKTITCLSDKEQQVEVKGIPRPISLKKITALQLKRCLGKRCQVYATYVEDTAAREVSPEVDDFPVLQEFADVFQKVSGFPPKREVDFSIDLVLGSLPISRTP